MESGERCCKEIWDGFGSRPYICGKPAKMQHQGKNYCGVHDPVKRAQKQAERDAKWAAERKASMAAGERRAKEQLACEGVPTEQLEPGILKRLLESK